MAKQPEDIVFRILRDIQSTLADNSKTLADHTKRFERLEGRLQHVEQQFDDLRKIVTYSLGQSSEVQFRQSQQEPRIDELFKQLEKLLSGKEPV
jgi:uncharacterized coiled-coil protein SlyX